MVDVPPLLLVKVFPVLLLEALSELLVAVPPLLRLDVPPVIVFDSCVDVLVVPHPVLLVDFPPELLVDVLAAFADACAYAEMKAVADASLDACMESIL